MFASAFASRRPYSRRDSIIDTNAAAERRVGHADAEARARSLLEMQDALDARTMSRSQGCRAAGVPEGAPWDGSLPTGALREVLAAIRALPL